MKTESNIAYDYSSATGLLRPIVEAFLLNKDEKPDAWAQVFVKIVDEYKDTLPDSLLELKHKVKQKYNI